MDIILFFIINLCYTMGHKTFSLSGPSDLVPHNISGACSAIAGILLSSVLVNN